MAAAAELTLLEKSLGLSKGNKYSAQGERQIPVLQTNSGPSLTGLTTIAAHLVKQANKEHLLGSSAEEKAVVQQWLEFRVTRVDGQSSKDDIRTVLKDLNSYLEDKVYLTGYNFTLADILLYYGLHRFIVCKEDWRKNRLSLSEAILPLSPIFLSNKTKTRLFSPPAPGIM